MDICLRLWQYEHHTFVHMIQLWESNHSKTQLTVGVLLVYIHPFRL
jgi:hypothetical protein